MVEGVAWMSWYSEKTPGRYECVVWTCYCYGCRGSRWYAHEDLVSCVELKACNWKVGTETCVGL